MDTLIGIRSELYASTSPFAPSLSCGHDRRAAPNNRTGDPLLVASDSF